MCVYNVQIGSRHVMDAFSKIIIVRGSDDGLLFQKIATFLLLASFLRLLRGRCVLGFDRASEVKLVLVLIFIVVIVLKVVVVEVLRCVAVEALPLQMLL